MAILCQESSQDAANPTAFIDLLRFADVGFATSHQLDHYIMPVHDELLREFRGLDDTGPTPEFVMERISQRLHERMPRYNWVGFYLVDATDPGVLLVGPFVGSFTPNARIPLNTGLCGAAASSGQSVVVHDVSKDSRYLAGWGLVKSEIVVPIFAKNKLAAELNIESYFEGTFTTSEQDFVEACASIVGAYLGK
jgi:GAF domain-containing protein